MLTINAEITFNNGKLINNMYKYYFEDCHFNPEFNLAKLKEFIDLYQAIPLFGSNSNDHFFCILCENGILQMTGNNSNWYISTNQLVFLKN